MARSTYIYVLRTNHGTMVGAFTVKHELVSYITKRMGSCADLPGWWVERHKDGKPHDTTVVQNVTSFMES